MLQFMLGALWQCTNFYFLFTNCHWINWSDVFICQFDETVRNSRKIKEIPGGGGGGEEFGAWQATLRMKTPGGGGLRQKCPLWEGAMDIFLNYTLNVVHRPVHKSKTKESYALHNHSALLQVSQSLEKSLSFSSSLNFIFPSKLLEFLWKSLNFLELKL